MLLKNVLKGLKKEYDIKQLTIIKGYTVYFSGEIKVFEANVKDALGDFGDELLNSEVIARDNISNDKHFIFI